MKVGDRRDWLIGLGTAGFIVVVTALVMTWSWPFSEITDDDPVDCSDFEFDRDDWDDEDSRNDEARALERCDTLIGVTRDEVVAMLGEPGPRRDPGLLRFDAGAPDRLLEVDRDQSLLVRFDPDGRVESVNLPEPAPAQILD